MEDATFSQLGISVLLGLLVGLQREHAASGVAGMRTFPLITLFGTVSAKLAFVLGGWILAAGLLGIVAVIGVGHFFASRGSRNHLGTTTDVAMLLMFAVGALLALDGMMTAAIVVGGAVAVLLQFKPELHMVAEKLAAADLRAIMQFVLITCIVLPVLPNRTYDPLHVLNPREIWLMVVLIVGMSLAGYIIYKFFGRDAGVLLGGVLGGAVSSTATTVSYSRGTRGNGTGTRTAAVVIMIASAVMYVRVLIAVAVVCGDFFAVAAVPVLILMALTLVPAIAIWLRVRRHLAGMPEQANPTQLRSALVFGAMYALVLFALAAAKRYVGGHGLYLVAGLSGLTEMDAITLSTARLVGLHEIAGSDGWRMIITAALANLISKAALAGLVGGWRLLVQIIPLFLIPLVGGVVLLWLL